VRAMFEGIVNASYIQSHPEKAEDFKRYGLLFIQKSYRQIENLSGRTVDAKAKQSIEDSLDPYRGADGKVAAPKNDWTDLNLVDRAKDVNLGKLVALAYYRAIEIAHPSMLHVLSQLKKEDGQTLVFGNSQKNSEEKVREALAISHFLAIEVLILLHKTFGDDDLKAYIVDCSRDYNVTWKPITDASS